MAPPSTQPQRLRDLYVLGQERNLWETQGECATAINVKESTLKHHLQGNTADTVIAETINKIEELFRDNKIDTEPLHENAPMPDTCRGLFYLGVREGLWKTVNHCAGIFKRDRGTLAAFVRIETMKGVAELKARRGFYLEIRDAMKAHIEEKCERFKKPVRVPDDPGAATVWADDVVAGKKSLTETPGNRFVRQAKDVKVPTKFSPREVQDTTQLVMKAVEQMGVLLDIFTEIRRRFEVATNFKSQSDRSGLLRTMYKKNRMLIANMAAIKLAIDEMAELDPDVSKAFYDDRYLQVSALLKQV